MFHFRLQNCRELVILAAISAIVCSSVNMAAAVDFEQAVRPVLQKYCVDCHTGDDAEGEFDFSKIRTNEDIARTYETWESVVGHLKSQTMPPEDEPQPTKDDRARVIAWYEQFVTSAEPQPALFQARRLSVLEFRNSLRSVLGFDLELAVIEAEQTLAQRSLVTKLLPVDPPGASGFTNDTHANPLTVQVWDQYGKLIDTGIEELFSPRRRSELEALAGPIDGEHVSQVQAAKIVRLFTARAWRRPIADGELTMIVDRCADKEGEALTDALKLELKAVLMSPSFTHRGMRLPLQPGQRHRVDAYELAERLSYFLWADMPDDALLDRAAVGDLHEKEVLAAEVDRLLASPKARSLSEIFGAEWFTLKEIERLSKNPPQMVALRSQPFDFLHYLFTKNRPLLELIDSDVAFVSPFTSGHYGQDSQQLKRYRKQRGIEVEIVPNQQIALRQTKERGGILTIPGVLAMNRGPINRGAWVLERILGEHLPDPPANVGQVAGNKRGENLTFRQRFEQHRSRASCAACHDKIDPIGFALEGFNASGAYIKKPNDRIDTSGRLPSGETFAGIEELKKILVKGQRETVLRNIVRRAMSYALCRKLTVHDYATVESIVRQMDKTDGTWRDLFVAIASTPQFQETIAPKSDDAKG